MAEALKVEDFNIVHPDHYADRGYPHDIFTRLRREDPVHWWDRTEGVPFWAITKHADITEISKAGIDPLDDNTGQILISGPSTW